MPKDIQIYCNVTFFAAATFFFFKIFHYDSSVLYTPLLQLLVLLLINCHWLGHATAEPCLAHSCQDINFSIFEHSYNLAEGRSNIRIGVPASSHDLTQFRKAIIWNDWSYTLVHHRKCCLHSCHVLKWKQPCDQLPENNTKAIYVDFLGIGSMLDHLSAMWKEIKEN